MRSDEELSDEALIHRIRDGDQDAFRVLFDRYVDALRAKVRQALPARVRRKVSVSDVLQEARIIALRRCPDFQLHQEGSFGAWLSRIVDHRVRNAIRFHAGTAKRAALREVSRGDRPDTAEFLSRGPSPSEMAMASEMKDTLRQVLEALPEDYREVLRLAQAEHLALRDVADRMGRSEEAIQKLHQRALSRFRELYETMVPGGEDG
jgi:RNA polymerase sigma-70 factor (ECF subfamily)